MTHPVVRPLAAREPFLNGSSACYRSPFCITAVAAVIVLATVKFNVAQRHKRDMEGDEGSSRAKRTLGTRKRRDKGVC